MGGLIQSWFLTPQLGGRGVENKGWQIIKITQRAKEEKYNKI
jgi:hypothetical protein